MADLKVLMVLDGDRFNFGPQQGDVLDSTYFGITFLTSSLSLSATPTIQVDKAHRRGLSFKHGDPPFSAVDTSVGLSAAYQDTDFVFTPGVLDQYDVLWMIGDEGKNGGGISSNKDADLTAAEKKVIADFMKSGGGVFAVGDHDGIGAHMCGDLPRVRLMRRWFEWDDPHGDAATGQAFVGNWSAAGSAATATAGQATDRNDTLQADSVETNQFYFDDQGDPTPQKLRKTSGGDFLTTSGSVHSILRGVGGAIIGLFPDHMHEGEATDFTTICAPGTPWNPNDNHGKPNSYPLGGDPEFPNIGGFQPTPEVIAYGDGSAHTTNYGADDNLYGLTAEKSRGVISVYDGRAAGIGRVVTGSTFHHYLDKNILGDPKTNSATAGVGPTNSNLGLPAGVRAGIANYFINTVVWLARPRLNVNLWVIKGSFGFEESQGGASFANAFYVTIDGYSPSAASHATIDFTGPFKATGASLTVGARIPGGNSGATQRVLFPCTVSSIPEGAFPSSTSGAEALVLLARVTIGGVTYAAEAVFELTPGADPYFKNSGGSNPFYLSQDLRVFQFPTNASSPPFVSLPAGANGPYTYIKNLIAHLNNPTNHFTTSSGSDPFQTLKENNDLTEASSVDSGFYNFAIARVRMKGGSASVVRVFFRLFATSTNDTDFDAQTTYLSTYNSSNRPATPLPGLDDTTFPMFASSGGSDDYSGGKINELSISTSGSAETWKYFGCYLDVFGLNLPGTHHCLVAQIAYDDAPIINSNGVTLSPESSDKLAQRNMQITTSGNPGGFDAHRVPQTFQTRPSVRLADGLLDPEGQPDELMIDWGNTPIGTVASIYWPEANSLEVVRLAMLLYSESQLEAIDEHTIQCKVSSRLTFVPVPFGTATTFAGLFTLDIPIGVAAGQEFNLVVRRISTRTAPRVVVDVDNHSLLTEPSETAKGSKRGPVNSTWRYSVGAFQVKVPVAAEEDLLGKEENTLAIMKWRLQQTLTSDHWHPVLKRYVSFLSGRVAGFGGDPAGILPSPRGTKNPPKQGGHGGADGFPGHAKELVEHTGKVLDVLFDCFGEFRGFILETCSGRFAFVARERRLGKLILRACRDRLNLTVISLPGDPHEIREVIVRR